MRSLIIKLLPLPLILSTALVFRWFSISYGKSWATIIGFLFYEIVWCICIPLIILGRKGYVELFIPKKQLFIKQNWWVVILGLLTIIGSLILFVNGLKIYSLLVFLIGIPFTIFNGICEEVFWRGMFTKEFGNNIFWLFAKMCG